MYDLKPETLVTVKQLFTDWQGYTIQPGTRAKIVQCITPSYVPAFGGELYIIEYLNVEHDAFHRLAVDPVNVDVLIDDE